MLSKHLPALSLVIFSGIALVSASAAPTNQVTVLEKEGVVEAARANETNWSAAQTNQVLRVADRIRVADRYVTAIETALGHHLQLVLTEHPETAHQILADLQAQKRGRASIAPLRSR